MRTFQQILFTPQTEWVVPEELKDLRGHKEIAVDLETCDPELTELGSGNVVGRGKIVGISVAVEGWAAYYPIAHEGGGNMDKKLVLNWLQDLFKQDATKANVISKLSDQNLTNNTDALKNYKKESKLFIYELRRII